MSARIPKLGLHQASGQYRVKHQGKHRYFGKDKAAAEKAYRRWVAETFIVVQDEAGSPPLHVYRPPTGTVDEVTLAYWEHARVKYADRGQAPRVWQAIEAVSQLYGSTPAANFRAPQLKAVRQSLLARPSRKAPDQTLSRNYVNSLIGCLQTAWVWLESEGLVPEGSSAHLATVVSLREGEGGLERDPVLPVDADVVKATLPHLAPVPYVMVMVQRLTGMRPGEVCGMVRRDLSVSPAEVLEPWPRLRVSALPTEAGLVWVYAPGQHKTRHRGKARLVPIGPLAQGWLDPYLLGCAPDQHLFRPSESVRLWRSAQRDRRRSKVQPSQVSRASSRATRRPGDRYTVDSYRQAIERACAAADVEPWHPNQLRHSAATEVNDALDWDHAQALLGHSSPDMTATYALQALRKAARAVAELG